MSMPSCYGNPYAARPSPARAVSTERCRRYRERLRHNPYQYFAFLQRQRLACKRYREKKKQLKDRADQAWTKFTLRWSVWERVGSVWWRQRSTRLGSGWGEGSKRRTQRPVCEYRSRWEEITAENIFKKLVVEFEVSLPRISVCSCWAYSTSADIYSLVVSIPVLDESSHPSFRLACM